MPRLARACYRTLGLISFFTVGPEGGARLDGARGRQRRRGGRQDPLRHRARLHPRRGDRLARPDRVSGSNAEARKRGLERVEGKDYVVQDGDVINVRFNV